MKALITGITGFVGGHLAEHLLASGDEVVGVSTSGRWPVGTPESLRQSVRIAPVDLATSEGAQQLEADFRPDVIYHLAAISIPSECGGDEPTPKALAANVDGTKRILEWSEAIGARRVLFVSTSHVYAQPTSRDERCHETDVPRPKNAYGKTKLLAEQAALDAVRRGAIEVIIARAFQHTGPRQSPPMMLPEWVAQLAAGADPLVVRNRDTWIDLTDVRDVVRAYRLLMERGDSGEIYNVASGIPRRTGEILTQLLQTANVAPHVEETRPGERFDPIANVDRIAQAIDWKPRIPLETTLHDIWTRHTEAEKTFSSDVQPL